MSALGGYVEYSNKDKRWNCYINLPEGKKHVGFGMDEKRANTILRSSLERHENV